MIDVAGSLKNESREDPMINAALVRRIGERLSSLLAGFRNWVGLSHMKQAGLGALFICVFGYLLWGKIVLAVKYASEGAIIALVVVLLAIGFAILLEGIHLCRVVQHIADFVQEVAEGVKSLFKAIEKHISDIKKRIFGDDE